jgi:hypothetical protein
VYLYLDRLQTWLNGGKGHHGWLPEALPSQEVPVAAE